MSAEPSFETFFSLLSCREFTYLSRTQSKQYESIIKEKYMSSFLGKKPLEIFFSVGGGYHARVFSDRDSLSFEVGLSELFAVYQSKIFLNKVNQVYPHGCRMNFIIDNMCAKAANGVNLEDSIRYIQSFRGLINELNLNKEMTLLAESDAISEDELLRRANLIAQNGTVNITQKDCHNALRFSNSIGVNGKEVEFAERYKSINFASREVCSCIANNGVHLVQRALPSKMAFRSFPGGDSKIQCGQVALLIENRMVKKPILLTSNNISKYIVSEYSAFGVLPSAIKKVLLAETKP